MNGYPILEKPITAKVRTINWSLPTFKNNLLSSGSGSVLSTLDCAIILFMLGANTPEIEVEKEPKNDVKLVPTEYMATAIVPEATLSTIRSVLLVIRLVISFKNKKAENRNTLLNTENSRCLNENLIFSLK